MKATAILSFAVGALVSAPASGAHLSYTIFGPIKPNTMGQCPASSNDKDLDCLEDSKETALAGLLAPYYMWDESDECNYYSSNDSQPGNGSTAGQSHDEPRFYYQVRPILQGYPNIGSWYANDGWYHWVRVKYFFAYPRDCGSPGHQGDLETVSYDLYSTDLVNWAVYIGTYPKHTDSPAPQYTGDYLHDVTSSAGGSFPVVLADDQGHGSWAGLINDSPSDGWCGPDSQGHWFGLNYYCLAGADILDARSAGNYVYPGTSKNIGEPVVAGSSGQWNDNVMTVAENGVIAQTREYTGDSITGGDTFEAWGDAQPPHASFCGWQCASSIRQRDGTCNNSIHGQKACAPKLWNAVMKTPFVY